MWKRRRCRHDRLRGVYGDEIIHVGWKRSQCLDCGRFFDELPSTRETPGQPFETNEMTIIGEPATLIDEMAVWDVQSIINVDRSPCGCARHRLGVESIVADCRCRTVSWEPTAPLPPVVDKVQPKTPPAMGGR